MADDGAPIPDPLDAVPERDGTGRPRTARVIRREFLHWLTDPAVPVLVGRLVPTAAGYQFKAATTPAEAAYIMELFERTTGRRGNEREQ